MHIGISGGGPAGLTFALLMRRSHPACEITVLEQNPADATYGFGVVFARNALDRLEATEPRLFSALLEGAERWEHQTIVLRDEKVLIDGLGYAGIGRLKFLQNLHRLCAEAGVRVQFERRAESPADFAGCDLIVAADGLNSAIRDHHADAFGTKRSYLTNRFAWYGAETTFDSHHLTFRETKHGYFVGHHYRYSPTMSTFVVECDEATWQRLEPLDDDARKRIAEEVFADMLKGKPLLSNNSVWRPFTVLTNERWTHDNIVLMGDALRTAHPSIGSGTRLAMDDAIELWRAICDTGSIETAVAAYEERRRPGVEKLSTAGRNSYLWYEEFPEKMRLPAMDFVYDYMMRTGRMDEKRLAREAPDFMARYRRWRESKAA